MSEDGNIKGRIEAILYVTGEAVSLSDLARALETDMETLEKALTELSDEYDFGQRGFVLKRFADQVQIVTRPLYSKDVVRLLQPVQRQSLGQAVMETLAVIAYRQPVTRAEIEQVRGVKCDYSLQSLIGKGLVCETGRKDTVGHPALFGTTDAFLSHFGLRSLDDLPPLPEMPEETTGSSEEEPELTLGPDTDVVSEPETEKPDGASDASTE